MQNLSPYVDSFVSTPYLRALDTFSPLTRYIRNYALDKWAPSPSTVQWMTFEEKIFYTSKGRRRSQWIGTIGQDHLPNRVTVLFEPGSPPPPFLFLPAKEKYIPPPILSPREKKLQELRDLIWWAEYKARQSKLPPAPLPSPPKQTFLRN